MAAQPNLKVYTAVDKTFCYAGDTLTYVLSYRNYGAASASPVTITDTLDSDLLLVSASGSYSGVAVGGTGTIRWNIGTVPGLVNTAGGGSNLPLTKGAVTLVVRVSPTAVNQRICNVSQIYVGSPGIGPATSIPTRSP
jgi:uncharacterized repeat protein (TIGR01451 family)